MSLTLTQRVRLFAASRKDGVSDNYAHQAGWLPTFASLKRRRLAVMRGGRWYATKAGKKITDTMPANDRWWASR